MPIAVDRTMKVLYVKGTASDADTSTTQQLRATAPELRLIMVDTAAEALAEVRRTAGWHALMVSPSLPQNETLALIASLRRDRVPIAIVPVINEAQQELFASAVASGADDVLMRRGETLVNVAETLTRIRHSPHLFPVEQRRRIRVLYAGRDTLVWNLLDQVPFVKAEKIVCGPDGTCPVGPDDAEGDGVRCDAVVIDEQPGDAHPLQVLKSVKAQASDLPVIMLTSAGAGDIGTAALELGADDTVVKTGIFRRRLIAALRRVHQRLELTAQQAETRAREERLRWIVEHVPTGISVIASDGAVLAMNAAAFRLFGAAKPRDVVGRDFRQLVSAEHHEAVTDLLQRVTKGEPAAITFDAATLAGARVPLRLQGVVLERDARGGRGVIASLTPATVDLAPGAEPSQTAELTTLQESLQRLERHYAELEDARSREQTAWESERRRMEERLESAGRLAAEHDAFQAKLDEVSGELARTSEAFAAERQVLEARLHELEAAGREAELAGTARAELEATLESVREELRQAVAAHAVERSGWSAIREELEGRVREVDRVRHAEADHAADVAALRAELQDVRTRLTTEHDAWESARAQLEDELRHAREALWTEHNERGAGRADLEQQVSRLQDELAGERRAWDATRAELETDLRLARENIDRAHEELEHTRTRLQAELREVREALNAERATWDAARSHLEAELQDARARAGGAVDQWETARASLEAELRAAREALAGERAAWDAARAELESSRARLETEVRGLRETTGQAQGDWEDTRQRLEAELRDARETLGRERGGWDTARAELESTKARLDDDLQIAREAAGRAQEERDTARLQLEAELSDSREALAGERRQWDQTRSELEQARTRLEDELRTTQEALTRAHGGWDAARTDLAGARARLEDELRAAQDALNHERDTWDAARADLEGTQARLDGDLQAAREALDRERGNWDAARADLDDARARLEGELQVAREALDRERAGWNDTRAELEGTRARLEDELRSVQETLGRERGNWDAARGDLEGTRSGLEADLARAHEALRAMQMESDAQRTQIEAALREARETLDTERSASDQAREQLESELRQARTAAHAVHHEWEARVAQLETDLAEARERAASLEGLREALEAAHAELRHTDAAHAADRLAWQAATEALERQRADLDTRSAADRDAWTARLAALEADLRDADHIRQEHQRLSGAIDALRADYASMVQTLATERADRDRDRREIEALRATVDQHRQRGRELEADIERTAREADERAAQLDADHAARYRALEGELVQNAQRFARLSEEAERAGTALRGEYVRAAESHNRLIGSDLFGYAVTTLPGELVRCNDAFARLFGYTDAPDAMTRTEDRVFPGLAGRADLLARLTAEGHLDRVDSCFERLDGTPVRAVESLSLLSDQTDAEVLVEHIVVGVATGATSEQLQAHRLEEVGSLTTAMAPEIETLVATLHERSRDVRARLEESVVDSQDIETLTALASQVTMLVRQLAAFSRRQVREAEAADLNTAVARAEPILMRLVGDYIGFAVQFGETSPIAAHQDDLEQLFTSLVTLGRDLLPAGGSLMLETRRIPPGSATPDDDTDRALGGALLVVHASGYGVQFPGGAPALELVVQRCGGQLRLSGDPGWIVDIEVFFPRCGRPARSGWNWLVEGGQ